MGRRKRRRNRGRSRASRLLDPAGIFSKRRGRKSTSQATKAAVVSKKGDAQQAQAANVAAQQVQNQQAIGTMGPQIGGAAGPASAGGKQAGPKSPSKGMVGALASAGGRQLRGTGGGGRDGGLGRARSGRGSKKPGLALDRGTGGRDFGGGYRNRAFGMGRGERGYGMGRGHGGMAADFMGNRRGGGQDPNMIMNMGGGERGYGMGRGGRGFGMGRGGRDVMQSGMGGYGRNLNAIGPRQPQGRPNPYAGGGRQNIWDQGLAQTGRRGGGRRGVGGSSYNPASGRMEYASTPRNFSQRSQRGGGGRGMYGGGRRGFSPVSASMFMKKMGTTQGAFQLPEKSMIEGSPMHKKAEFRLLNQVLDSGGGESGNEFASSFANSLKSSQSTIDKIKANKKS